MNQNIRNMEVLHPGSFIRSELIDSRSLSITLIAKLLKVSRQSLSNIINEKSGVSPEMAARIAIVFGGTPEIWMRLQNKYDLAKVQRKIKQLKLVEYKMIV